MASFAQEQNLPDIHSQIQLSLGLDYACALHKNGKVKCWGLNQYGQLGYGDTRPRGYEASDMGSNLTFVDVGTNVFVQKVVTGRYTTCILSISAKVKCWGLQIWESSSSSDPQLAAGDNLPFFDVGSMQEVQDIVLGIGHMCVLLKSKQVKCWGANGAGQLGYGDNVQRNFNTASIGDSLPAIDLGLQRYATQITAGNSFTCALLDNTCVKCWGGNNFGQLGYGDTITRGDEPGEMGDNLPCVDIAGTSNQSVAKVVSSSFGRHSCAILSGGGAKCWGQGSSFGILGYSNHISRGDHANEMGDYLPFIYIPENTTILQIAPGSLTTCVLLNNLRVRCWGSNSDLPAFYSRGLLGIESSASGVFNSADLPDVMLGTLSYTSSIGNAYQTCVATRDFQTGRCWGRYSLYAYGDYGQDRGRSVGSMGDNLPFIDLGYPTPLTATIPSPTTQPTPSPTDQPTPSPTPPPPPTPSPPPTRSPTPAPTIFSVSTPAPPPTPPPTPLPQPPPTSSKCPNGTQVYIEDDQKKCATCVPGKFSDIEDSFTCRDCNAGTFAQNYGSTSCSACPDHYNSFSGASSCKHCSHIDMFRSCCPAGEVYSLVYYPDLFVSDDTITVAESSLKSDNFNVMRSLGFVNHTFLQINSIAWVYATHGINITRLSLVAGGGGGGWKGGGGGGAGGSLNSNNVYFYPGRYQLMSGRGGTGGTYQNPTAQDGAVSTIYYRRGNDLVKLFQTLGGGGGGGVDQGGAAGGSGGGHGAYVNYPNNSIGKYFPGGLGTMGQGNSGGGMTNSDGNPDFTGGGGGGAFQQAQAATSRRDSHSIDWTQSNHETCSWQEDLKSMHCKPKSEEFNMKESEEEDFSEHQIMLAGNLSASTNTTWNTLLHRRRILSFSSGRNGNFMSQPVCGSGAYLISKQFDPIRIVTEWTCEICPYGSYCMGDVRYQCPAGTTTRYTSSYSADDCITGIICGLFPCIAGSYCSGSVCLVCPRNYYCPDGSGFEQCPSGSYSPRASLQLSDCDNTKTKCSADSNQLCGSGTFCKSIWSPFILQWIWVCDECPAGSYCKYGTLYACPEGYSSPAASENLENCFLLPTPPPPPTPAPTPAIRTGGLGRDGDYIDNPGSAGEGIWELQYISKTVNSHNVEWIPAAFGGAGGSVSFFQTINCTGPAACSNYSENGGDAKYAGSGGAGHGKGDITKRGGSGSSGIITLIFLPECKKCSPGTYRSLEDGLCQRCEPGTYTADAGSSSCKTCEPGKYNDMVGMTFCETCAHGRTFSSSTAACSLSGNCVGPMPQTCSVHQASNVSFCTQCSAGYYLQTSVSSSTKYSTCTTGSYFDNVQGEYVYYTDTHCIPCRTNAVGVCTKPGERLEFCQQGFTRDATCVACTNAPPNATYTKPSNSYENNCEYQCNGGFYNYDQFKDGTLTPQCLPCAELPCPLGQYRSGCTGPNPDPVCLACDTYGNLPSFFNWSTYPGTIVMFMPSSFLHLLTCSFAQGIHHVPLYATNQGSCCPTEPVHCPSVMYATALLEMNPKKSLARGLNVFSVPTIHFLPMEYMPTLASTANGTAMLLTTNQQPLIHVYHVLILPSFAQEESTFHRPAIQT
jgi:alpha-tubulin suppressor-like RCC1 family protein